MEQRCAEQYRQLTLLLIEQKKTIALMESCTGGLLASLLTDTEGASAILKGSYVTYSNEAKIKCGVPADTIARFGVYSEETAIAMAAAARHNYSTDIGVGVTGSLGTVDPANADSVPGQVWYAFMAGDTVVTGYMDAAAAPTRHECKLMVAIEIGDKLSERLTDNFAKCKFSEV